jgi:hypothetical protein
MFQRLVDNALDFLSQAIVDIQDKPKYSMINFHASVELFVKARLMEEHWALVVAKPQEADWDKFVSGDFQSVSLDEAAKRLANIARSGPSIKAQDVFRAVTKHRRKMVHFFHEAHSGNEGKELHQTIVRQQLNAWFFLHGLIMNQWKETFKPWSAKIAEIDESLRKLHGFLEIVFLNLGDEIIIREKLGFLFKVCNSCGFKAEEHDKSIGVPYQSECKVCMLKNRCLKIKCPGCEGPVFFQNVGYSSCKNCKKSFRPDFLVHTLNNNGLQLNGEKYGTGNCSDCNGTLSVIKIKDKEYLCTSCLGVFESLELCNWCDVPNTGDMRGSDRFGCDFCLGSEPDIDIEEERESQREEEREAQREAQAEAQREWEAEREAQWDAQREAEWEAQREAEWEAERETQREAGEAEREAKDSGEEL